MKNCTYRLSLDELMTRPASEMWLRGADGNDDGQGDPGNGDNGDGDKDKDDKSKSGENDKDSEQKKPAELVSAEKKIVALEKEKDRHYDLRKVAETERDEVKLELAKLKKDGVTDEETKKELETLKRENGSSTATIQELRLKVAFLEDNTHKWKNPKTALRLADMSKVEIDDKGVHGLEEALEKLAKAEPYLLVEESNDGDEKPKPKKTGNPPNNKDSGDEKSRVAREATLKSKYPGLRR